MSLRTDGSYDPFAVFGSSSTNKWAVVGIGVAMGLIMLVIAIIGIKITARVQVSMATIEYLILIGLAIAGLVWVLSHHPGSVPITRGWFSVTGIVVAGLILLLVARFVLRSSFFQIARESEVNTHRRVGRR
jgi:amino acid transporter